MVDLDELDRLHASLPELEPQTIYVGDAEALAIICEAPWRRCVAMHDAATNAVTLLRAYPALAAEVRALREVAAAAEAYRACREGMQTQGGQNALDRRDTAARLAEALAKVPAMSPPTDARCPNCGGYPRTEAQLAWKAAHPRSQRRWCRMKMWCLYRATDGFDPPGREYTVGDAVGLRRTE